MPAGVSFSPEHSRNENARLIGGRFSLSGGGYGYPSPSQPSGTKRITTALMLTMTLKLVKRSLAVREHD
jgi:hypothetical protein